MKNRKQKKEENVTEAVCMQSMKPKILTVGSLQK